MKRKMTKRFKYILLIVTSIGTIWFIYDYWRKSNIDRNFTFQIDQFKITDTYLSSAILNDLRIENNYSMFPHAKVCRDFTISVDDSSIFKHHPEIQNLFDKELVTDVHILCDGEILFQLKWCDRPNCSKNNKGFFGFYTHYLSFDNVKFDNVGYTHPVEQHSLGNYNYYIIWSAKG